jgi:2-oxoglutarate dehydrogenase complex dehydrogenase (E1) component-like enzyme
MVQAIEKHPSVRSLFEAECIRRKVLTEDAAREMDRQYADRLTAARDRVRAGAWKPQPAAAPEPLKRSAPAGAEELRRLGLALAATPEGFTPHLKIDRMLRRWVKMIEGGDLDVDFGLAESLSYASLLAAGVPIRLTGEDSGRGTFSHRHSVLRDWKTGEAYVPLNHLDGAGRALPGQARFEVVDSLLSEAAVLGFEYGYGVCRPEAFVLWEAQFGDFVNGAQVQIDQFLVSGEVKWGQKCGLTLLLPHGHDGQGPEHTSARLERFLQSAAKDNLRVANPTTAAQWFHLLREQALLTDRKALVVMSPKSLLRAPEAMSPFENLTRGGFAPVLDDPRAPAGDAKRVLLCSGKVYYDLAAERDRRPGAPVAVARLERLYPFPTGELARVLDKHPAAEIVWVQEEAENMGAAAFAAPRLRALVGAKRALSVVSRAASPSPATGSARVHAEEQRALVAKAFAGI